MEQFNAFIDLLDSAIRLSTPLLLACLAGMYSERSGVFDIGLEGKMLAGAFGAATVAFLTGSAWLGLLAGIGVAVAMAGVHGLASITFRGDQIVSGVAINFLAAGMTTLLGQNWFRQGGRTPAPPEGGRFLAIDLPFADAVKDVPFLGGIYSGLISGHNIIVYIAFLMVPAELVGAVPHTVRSALAGDGREPQGRRHCGYPCQCHAVFCGADHRHSDRHGRHLFRHRPIGRFHQ